MGHTRLGPGGKRTRKTEGRRSIKERDLPCFACHIFGHRGHQPGRGHHGEPEQGEAARGQALTTTLAPGDGSRVLKIDSKLSLIKDHIMDRLRFWTETIP